MNDKQTLMWDSKVKPAAREVIEMATVDQECIKEYVGGMIWAVEHDIADGRFPGLGSLNCLMQVKGVFARRNDSYFKNVHPNTSPEEIERMYVLSDLIENMLQEMV